MGQPDAGVADGLRTLLGADRVGDDPETLRQRAGDTWPLSLLQRAAGAPPTLPVCVVRPTSTAEVALALAYLGRKGVPSVPYGGGSGVAGGAQPAAGHAVIDLGRMDQILDLDERNLTVTAQAGVVLGRLEAWLNERGYQSGHYPQSIDVAQLGGLVATRSSGQFSTKYGNIEDLVLGLEAVLPDGQTVCINAGPRRAVGPDLRHIWLGSEGAFGVITEVTLRVFRRPAARWLGAYAVASMREGLLMIQELMQQGWRPAVARLHDAFEAQRSYADAVQSGESILLLLSEGPAGYPEAESGAIDAIVRAAGGRPLGPAPVEAWLAHRNDVEEFYRYIDMGVLVDTIEVAAPWTAVADIYEVTLDRLPREVPELVLVCGHSSHSYAQGTNLYFTVAARPEPDPAAVARVYGAIWSRVMEITLAAGGAICHHHGIGKLRTPWVAQDLGTAYRLLQSLKSALDPKGLLNPGTLLPLPGQRPPWA